MAQKFEINKFDGCNNFGLWRVKMCALLVHQGVVSALACVVPQVAADDTNKETNDLSAKRKVKNG